MRYSIILFIFPLFIIDGCGANNNNHASPRDSISYAGLKKEIKKEQQRLNIYYESGSSAKKDSLIIIARKYIFDKIVDDIFPCWFNTPWDFNGTTDTPGKGKISCGYFVTAVLSDAGFDIPRATWAQMASEGMIKRMTTDITRFSNRPMGEVESYIDKRGDGLFIVGLDCHVGFIYKKGGKVQFVHANYYKPETGVMSEKLKGKNPLNDSKYRVIGKILQDEMVIKWLENRKFE